MEDMLVSGDFELNEWRLLRDQFRALVRGGSDDIEEILDVHFRRRFSELIDRVAARKNLSAREAQ
jgi:hypothetical protein